LIELARREVQTRFDVVLALEVELLGEWDAIAALDEGDAPLEIGS